MIALYMDENVQGAISRELQQRGIDVLTVQEDCKSSAPDPEVMDRAEALSRVLFTHDDDLLTEATQRLRSGRNFAGVIYAHQEKVSIGQRIEDLELICVAEEFAEYANRPCRRIIPQEVLLLPSKNKLVCTLVLVCLRGLKRSRFTWLMLCHRVIPKIPIVSQLRKS